MAPAAVTTLYADASPGQWGAVCDGEEVSGYFPEPLLGGYTACGIPLVRSANGNGNGISFPLVSVTKIFESSVSVRFR